MNYFKIGDTVSVLDEAIIGVVKNINQKFIKILTSDGFEMEFQPSELVLHGGLSRESFLKGLNAYVVSEKEMISKKKPSSISKKGVLPPMEVDLHIHQLVKHPKELSNFEMLTLQLDTAKHKIEFAIRKKIQRIIFIHGVGEGVLRAELEYLIRRYEDLSYQDADYQKYGYGAIEVYIPQKILGS